jgi:hypothetical protein
MNDYEVCIDHKFGAMQNAIVKVGTQSKKCNARSEVLVVIIGIS